MEKLEYNRSCKETDRKPKPGVFLWKIKNVLFLGLCLLLPGILGAQTDTELMEQARSHAKTLSAAEMKGRGYQEDGHFLAARYIADRYAQYGLLPVKGIGSDDYPYFQQFSFATNVVHSLSLKLDKVQLEEGRQFIAASNTGRGEVELDKVRNLGYGMPEDFGKKDKGKVVVFKSGLPPKIEKDPVQKKKYNEYASDDFKLQLAHRSGAVGAIVIKQKLTAGLSPMPVDFPVLEVLEDQLPKKKVKQAALEVDAGLKRVTTQNVIGMVRGSEQPDSFLVFCGHYDHLGMQGKAIFYGGNDNASGTAMLLSLAEHFAKPQNQPRFSMLFIAFGGEEAGLHGSRHYVQKEPAVPLEQTSFVMNMDLMANGDEGATLVAGANFPAHRDLFRKVNDDLKALPEVKSNGNRPNSDHYFFVEAGVPAMFIFTLGGPPHYHDVNDTYEEMRFSKFLETRELLIDFAKALQEPGWRE